MAICKQRRETSGENNSFRVLILDSQTPELLGKNICGLSHPICGILLRKPQQTRNNTVATSASCIKVTRQPVLDRRSYQPQKRFSGSFCHQDLIVILSFDSQSQLASQLEFMKSESSSFRGEKTCKGQGKSFQNSRNSYLRQDIESVKIDKVQVTCQEAHTCHWTVSSLEEGKELLILSPARIVSYEHRSMQHMPAEMGQCLQNFLWICFMELSKTFSNDVCKFPSGFEE